MRKRSSPIHTSLATALLVVASRRAHTAPRRVYRRSNMTVKTTISSSRTRLLLLLVTGALAGAVLTMLQAPQASAQATEEKPAGDQPTYKIPQTFEDHMALAERYRKKAATYREEAEIHEKMLAGYRKDASLFPNKSGIEPPWFTKLRKHCEDYINRAEALAAEADRFAEFHRMRALEFRGE